MMLKDVGPDEIERTSFFSLTLTNRNLPSMFLRIVFFIFNAIIVNLAAYLFLLGTITVCCPQSFMVPNLLAFDMHGFEFIGLRQLMKKQTVNLFQDIPYLTWRFRPELRCFALALCILGIVLYLLSLIGCYCAVAKSCVIQQIYTIACNIIMTFMLLSHLICLRESFIEKSDIMDRIRCFFRELYDPQAIPSDSMDDNFVDFLQSRLGCCGIYNGTQYFSSQINPALPLSCCQLVRLSISKETAFLPQTIDCVTRPNGFNSHIHVGCFSLILDFLRNFLGRLIVITWIMSVLGLTYCIILRRSAPKKKEIEESDEEII